VYGHYTLQLTTNDPGGVCGPATDQVNVLVDGCDNPALPPACPQTIILILDESGSMVNNNGSGTAAESLRNAVINFLISVSENGSFVGIVEFNSQARFSIDYTEVTDATWQSGGVFYNYIYNGVNGSPSASFYDPEDYSGADRYTNWEASMQEVQSINNNSPRGVADLVIFFTDGDPTAYNASSCVGGCTDGGSFCYGIGSCEDEALDQAINDAEAVKAQGSHLFSVAFPNPTLVEENIIAMTGAERYSDLQPDFKEADYLVAESNEDLLDIFQAVGAELCGIDLNLTKTASTETPGTGQSFDFEISVLNEGSSEATGVAVGDVLPAGLSLVSWSASQGSYAGDTWTIGSIASGSTVTLTLTVTGDNPGSYTNCAEVTFANESDVDSYPNNGDRDEDDYDCEQVTLIYICLQPDITNPGSQSACDSYTLPTIEGTNLSGDEAYYGGSGGTGTQYAAGAEITASTTLFIYDFDPNDPTCFDEEQFSITIFDSPDVTNPGPQEACGSYTLPAISGTGLSGNQAYYTGPEGTGTQYNIGSTITATIDLYAYDGTGTTPNCYDEELFTVTINPVPGADAVVETEIDCYEGSGVIQVTGSGGTAPYDYYLDGNLDVDGDGLFTAVAGTYEYYVEDSEGCSSATGSITIEEPTELTAQVVVDHHWDCHGKFSGEATVTPGGGTPGYTYEWNSVPLQTGATASGLAPGQYSVTVEDLNECEVVKTIEILEACFTLEKTGAFNDENSNGEADPGETISYTFTITNTGQVTLTNVTLTDPKVTVIGGPIASLAPAASDITTFIASYAITQVDIDAGQVDNTATADSNESGPETDDETTILTQTKTLQVTKNETDRSFIVGEYITYAIIVENTGNVTISNIDVVDDNADILTGNPIGTLAPGASAILTAQHQVAQADVNAGFVTNSATATGDSPSGTDDVSDISDTGTDVDGQPIPNNEAVETPNTLDPNNTDGDSTNDPTVTPIAPPDVTAVITATPNVMNGQTSFTIYVEITEINNVNTTGLITVKIPKDQRWELVTYDPSLTTLGGERVDNPDWTYTEETDFHVFTSNDVIPGGGFSTFGFEADWDAGVTQGIYTITAQISEGSGGENRIDNNVDAEKLDYFID
jgi:uncharacterized repeat protein (TIGR01451 family)